MNIYIWVWKFQTKYISSIMSGLSLQKEFYSMVHQELEKLYLQKPLDRFRREALFIILFLINKLFQDWKLALYKNLQVWCTLYMFSLIKYMLIKLLSQIKVAYYKNGCEIFSYLCISFNFWLKFIKFYFNIILYIAVDN